MLSLIKVQMALSLNPCVLMLIICVIDQHAYTLNYNGVVYPDDPFKFIGQTLELFCNITNTNIRENASALYFEHIIGNTTAVVPSKYIEILTTKTIRLSKRNVQLSDNGRYICQLKTYQGNQLIGNQIVKVDFRPGQIKDFKCRVYNWESMLCTWDLGIQYKHLDNINISLVYTQDGTQYDCPVLNLTSCMWPDYEYHHGHLYYIQINVSSVNKKIILGYNTSVQYRVETRLYETSALAEQHNSSRLQAGIQPAPVMKLKADGINSSCVNLTWTHSARFRDKFYKAYYNVNTDWREISLNNKEVKNYYSLVCNLHAHTLYKFRVAVLPMPAQTNDSGQEFLSDWQYVEIQTSEDVPATSPDICNGCFSDINCSHAILNNLRCIQLIWKDLNATEKRGEITQYSVKVLSMSNELLNASVNSTQTPMITVDIEIKSTENMRIELTPGTKIGFANKSSHLFIPAKSRMPKPPSSFLVEREKLSNAAYHIYISWAALEYCPQTNIKYTNVTILWCRSFEKKCQENVNWTVLAANIVTHELTLWTSDVMIGISAEVFDGTYTISSGIIWADCIYTRNQVPQHPPKNVRKSSAQKLLKNSVHIVWEPSVCSKETSFVIEYLIKYCPTAKGLNCSDREKTENVSNHKNDVILKNLKGNTRYKLHIQAVSSAGVGPSSDTFLVDVEEAPPDSETTEVSIIIIVVIFTFILTSLCIVCAFQRCQKRKIEIQKYMGGQEQSSLGSNTSDDSQLQPMIQNETDCSATENSSTSFSSTSTREHNNFHTSAEKNNSENYIRMDYSNTYNSKQENFQDYKTPALIYSLSTEACSDCSNQHFSNISLNLLRNSPSLNNTSSGVLVYSTSFDEQESGSTQMANYLCNSSSTDTESIPYCKLYGEPSNLWTAPSLQKVA